ncbi:MAG: hypothetical protein IT353_23440 [Gemmatimonadaceae bacterium]|nr:hypothetical protein [Gemmatimonadaceae bacterium]
MSGVIAVLIVVGAFCLLGVLLWQRHSAAAEKIRRELAIVGATDVTLRADWFDADSDTMTFNVTYETRAGIRQSTRCKVATRWTADDRVYWSDPPSSG